MASSERDPEAVRLGATIRALREAYGLRLTELARAIGVSQPYMSNMELGEKKAPPHVCRDVAATLRIPLAAITVEGYDALRDPEGTEPQRTVA